MEKQISYIDAFFNSEEFALLTYKAEDGDGNALEVLEELTLCLESAHYFLKLKDKDRTDYEIRRLQKIISKTR